MNNKIVALIAVAVVAIAGWMIFKDTGVEMLNPESANTGANAAAEADSSAEGEVKEFTVTGQPFSFTPNTMTVNKGDTVRITFMNSAGFHDFVIDEFNVHTSTIQAGQSEMVTFVADEAGTFEYYCSVGTHRQQGMVGTLTVLE